MIGSKVSIWHIKNGGSENGLFNFRSQVVKKTLCKTAVFSIVIKHVFNPLTLLP